MILSLSRGAAVPLLLQRQLTGIGQIYFQASPVFGAVLVLCLYLNGPALALGCMLGVCSASLAAWVMRFADESRNNGLYSFNGALTGIGLCATYRLDASLLAWVAASGLAAAVLTDGMRRLRMVPLTLPFVLLMWLAMAAGPGFGLQLSGPAFSTGCGSALVNHLFFSLGQAAFIGVAPLGMLLWSCLARHDWHLAMSALAAAALTLMGISATAALWPGIDAHMAGAGINCTLTMLALGSRQCKWRLRLAGSALSIVLAIIFGSISLPYFTLPFIFSTWIILRAGRT